MTTRPTFAPIPPLNDAGGWYFPHYYSTIQYADVDGDGRAELIARGAAGIQVWDLDRSRLWAGWPAGTEMTDAGNWNQPQYYSTIRCADIDGDGRAELLARGARGIAVYRFEPSTRQWVQLPDGPALNDASGWSNPQYYTTIQYADVDGDGRAELVARGSVGIHVYKCDPASHTWSGPFYGPALSDAAGWNQPQYYATIQCADVDGDGRAELIARGSVGIHVYKCDPASHTWSGPFYGPALDDAGNWNRPECYTTIHCADLDGDGRAELIIRSPGGIAAFKCILANLTWTQLHYGPSLSDEAHWNQPQYYATIQYADIDGDGRAELVARTWSGIIAFKYDPATHTWPQLPDGPTLSDATGWAGPHYYATIHCADIDGDGRAELLARSGDGILAFRFMDGAWRLLSELRAQTERDTYNLLMQRPLGVGEAVVYREDWFGVPVARLLASDFPDIGLVMPDPTGLRVGRDTGVTIYQQSDFQGVAQQIFADVPQIQQTRAGKLASLQTWPDANRPFSGRWAISTPYGYLQVESSSQLTTLNAQVSANVNADALFRFASRGNTPEGRPRVAITATNYAVAFANPAHANLMLQKGHAPSDADNGIMTLIEELDRAGRMFALQDATGQWIAQDTSGRFFHTSDRSQRTIFTRAFKFADDETQIGTLRPGEVALYENPAYWGRAWISLADMSNFLAVDGLNDVVSSLRCGPETAATLYVDIDFSGTRQDAVTALPTLSGMQVGDNALSALHVWHNIAPSQVGITATARLSQDYRQDGAQFTPFSAYRTVIQFPKDVSQVELWATDAVTVTVNGQQFLIDEDHSATFSPNSLGRIMVLNAASGISTPGLKLRTNTMASYERCVIFPDREVHGRLAKLPDGAIYAAQNRDSTPLVNRATVTSEQAANVQYTITRAMATLSYDTPGSLTPRVRATNLQGASWLLDFGAPITQPSDADYLKDPNAPEPPPPPLNPATLVFNGPALRQLSASEVGQLLAQADASGGVLALGFFDDLWSGIKKAATIVVTAVRDAIVVVGTWVENAVKKVVTWVVDTAEKVATFVQGVVEKIGVAIHQFVQWLEFVFDWDDILATQHYLSDSVNQGLSYFKQTVSNSKGPVGMFFDRQAANLSAQINAVIDQLGGEPTDLLREANLPDELEWFLARLGDNTQHTTTVRPAGQSALQADWEQVKSSYSGVANGLLSRIDDLLAVATLLPNNPQHAVAGFLAIARDLLGLTINATRDTVMLLIDLAALLIDELAKLLNSEISIPFVSDFYSSITKGQKLTLLSLTALLVAIPTTVLGKVALGRRPFADAQPLALAVDATAARDWGIVNSVCSYINGVMAAALDPIPETNAPSFMWVFESLGLGLSFFSWLASFPGGYPNALSFSTSDEGEIWDVTLWSYGTFLLGLDIAAFVSGNLELFKRANDVSAAAKSVLSAVALVLSISANARAGASVAKGFADAIGTLPGIAAFARMTQVAAATEGISLGVLAGVDNLSATAGLILANIDA